MENGLNYIVRYLWGRGRQTEKSILRKKERISS